MAVLVRDTANSPFVNDKGKDVNSDWLAYQLDERSVLGHARVNKGRMKGDDPQIDTAQTPKRFDWRLALQGKIQKTFVDSIPNKYTTSSPCPKRRRRKPARLARLGDKVLLVIWGKVTHLFPERDKPCIVT